MSVTPSVASRSSFASAPAPATIHPALALLTSHSIETPHASKLEGRFAHHPSSEEHTDAVVHVSGGVVTVNGRKIEHPRFTKDTISWSESTPRYVSSGLLHVMSGGAFLSGMIASGADEASAVIEHVNIFDADLSFTTEVCRDTKASPQVWEPGAPLVITVHTPGGDKLPFVSGSLAGVDVEDVAVVPGSATSTGVGFSVNVSEFEKDNVANSAFAIPEKSTIFLSFDGKSFTGDMHAFDGNDYAWRGTIAPHPQPPPQREVLLHARDAAPAAAATAAVPATALSILDLLSLSTAGAEDVAKQKFTDSIIFAMDGWREKLFAMPIPALTPFEQKIISDNQTLYSTLCDAFITKQLSILPKEQGGPKDPLSADDLRKLQFFWSQGVTGADGYNDVSNRLTQVAWMTLNPRIGEYVNDPDANWGKRLYDELTTPEALKMAVLGFLSGFALTVVNRNCDLLLALSPGLTETFGTAHNPTKCTLATLYHVKFMSALGAKMSSSVSGSTESIQGLDAFVSSWLQAVRTAIKEKTSIDPSKDPDPGATTRLKEFESDLEDAIRKTGSLSLLSSEIAAGIAAAGGTSLLAKIKSWAVSSRAKTFSKGVIKAGAAAGFVYGLYSVVGAYRNWNNLTDMQKAQTIINNTTLSIDLLHLIADTELPEIAMVLSRAPMQFPGISEAIGEALAADVARDTDLITDSVRRVGPALESEQNAFTRVFGTGTKFMKGFAVVAAAAAVAFSAYQVYNDFAGHGPLSAQILDTLALTASALTLVGSIAAATVGECLVATLGPVGAVLGVVIMIVSLFIPPPDPDRPADDYMNERGHNFLAGVHVPDGWTPMPEPAAGGH